MLAYTFEWTDGEKPVLKAVFQDSSNSALNTFLLGEVRNFGDEIEQGLLSVINGEAGVCSFSGNVISLTADSELAVLDDDILEKRLLELSTEDLFRLVRDYRCELNHKD